MSRRSAAKRKSNSGYRDAIRTQMTFQDEETAPVVYEKAIQNIRMDWRKEADPGERKYAHLNKRRLL